MGECILIVLLAVIGITATVIIAVTIEGLYEDKTDKSALVKRIEDLEKSIERKDP